MSILLDALKKSEEQRQLGKTPEIHDRDDYQPEGGQAGGRAWIPLAMTAVAAILIAALVWQQLREPPGEGDSGDASSVARRLPQIGAETAPPDSEPENSTTARTPVESFQPPEPQTGQQVGGDQQAASDEKRQELARSFNQYQQPDSAAAGPATAGTEPADSDEQSPVREEPAQLQAREVPQPHESQPLSYWELPQNVRDGMPELRITVIVYAEQPEDRFLLINGRRLLEKAAMDGLVLEEIRRDGAVFRYRNYRFLVKR